MQGTKKAFSMLALCSFLALGGCSSSGWDINGVDNDAEETGSVTAVSANDRMTVYENDAAPPRSKTAQPQSAEATQRPAMSKAGSVTLVSRKVAEMRNDLQGLARSVAQNERALEVLGRRSKTEAANYYSYIAAIRARLQAGTTPGNPRLVEQLTMAQKSLDMLGQDVAAFHEMAGSVANQASQAAFLLDSVRATYGLSGAVEEDHRALQALEDATNQTVVKIDRMLKEVNSHINRRNNYLNTERRNLQTLSLAVANGELFGESLLNKNFSAAQKGGKAQAMSAYSGQRRPLVLIRFDRPNVNYEQAVYQAVNEALERYPNATFDLVAVTPSGGNPAEMALASSNARRHADEVLRNLTQMGLPADRVELSTASSQSANSSEVHLYIR